MAGWFQRLSAGDNQVAGDRYRREASHAPRSPRKRRGEFLGGVLRGGHDLARRSSHRLSNKVSTSGRRIVNQGYAHRANWERKRYGHELSGKEARSVIRHQIRNRVEDWWTGRQYVVIPQSRRKPKPYSGRQWVHDEMYGRPKQKRSSRSYSGRSKGRSSGGRGGKRSYGRRRRSY